MSMIQRVLDQIPVPAKWSADVGAIGAGLAHLLGFWRDWSSLVVTTLGGIWILVQMYFYLKDRYSKKGQ